MKHRCFRNTVAIIGVVLAVASMAHSQQFSGLTPPQPAEVPTGAADLYLGADQPQGPDAFGLNIQWTSIFNTHFQPVWQGVLQPVVQYPYVCLNPSDTNSSHQYWAQIDLPLGAEVEYVYIWVKDDDAISNWTAWVTGYEAGTTPYYNDYVSGSTTGATGYQQITLTLDPPVVIHEYEDLNGDFVKNLVATGVTIRANPSPAASTDMCFFGAAVRWVRTISPDPAFATFLDVPVGAFGHNHVEALVASGITAGCGGGNFCPNQSVTRVQMAVFLAKALGLHWFD
jgi:hypothetical protein